VTDPSVGQVGKITSPLRQVHPQFLFRRAAWVPERTLIAASSLTLLSSPDNIRSVAAIQIQSVSDPFRSPRPLRAALDTIRLAEAMGLLPPRERIDRLDLETVHRVGRAVSKAGIGSDSLAFMDGARDEEELVQALEGLRSALEESPHPESEIAALLQVLPADQLAELVRSSEISLRRYAAGQRQTPDNVADRVHFLVKVVSDLAGSYNATGIRQWFDRRRTQLGNRSPRQALHGPWVSHGAGARKVRALSRSLVSLGGT
jgi:hypothetical protein